MKSAKDEIKQWKDETFLHLSTTARRMNMGIKLDKHLPTEGRGDYPSFLKADEVGKSLKVKILKAREIEFSDRTGLAIDVAFKKEERTMVLNKTNTGACVQLIGEDTDEWEGKSLTLITVPVRNPTTGKMTKGIRIQL